MSNEAERYTELMAPAFVEGLRGVNGLLRDEGEISLVGLANAQQLVRPGIEAVDWDAVGLQDKVLSIGGGDSQEVMKPAEQANRLMVYAFDDAYAVISFCEDFVDTNEMPAGTSLGMLLIASKKPLLTIAELDDSDKANLVSALKNPSVATFYIGEEVHDSPIVYEADTEGNLRFEWSPQVRGWIKNHKRAGSGCPAHKMVVQAEDEQRQVLTHYFWDKLVTAMYPTQPE